MADESNAPPAVTVTEKDGKVSWLATVLLGRMHSVRDAGHGWEGLAFAFVYAYAGTDIHNWGATAKEALQTKAGRMVYPTGAQQTGGGARLALCPSQGVMHRAQSEETQELLVSWFEQEPCPSEQGIEETAQKLGATTDQIKTFLLNMRQATQQRMAEEST